MSYYLREALEAMTADIRYEAAVVRQETGLFVAVSPRLTDPIHAKDLGDDIPFAQYPHVLVTGGAEFQSNLTFKEYVNNLIERSNSQAIDDVVDMLRNDRLMVQNVENHAAGHSIEDSRPSLSTTLRRDILRNYDLGPFLGTSRGLRGAIIPF